MFSIVCGLIAICMGLWGLVSYWWYVVDVMLAILPIILLFGGFIALMAGIKKTGIRAKMNVTGFKKRSDEDIMTDKL